MICPNCDGSGRDMFESECRFCGGMGIVEPLTNEEWFCELSTEDKARFFASNKILNFDYQMWLEWLKEKHNE